MERNSTCGVIFCGLGLPGLALCMALMAPATAIAQRVLVEWNFPTNSADAVADGGTVANLSREISAQGGVGNVIYSNVTSIAGWSTLSAYAADWSGGADTKYWMVELTSTGYRTLALSSMQRSSNAGPAGFKAQYRTGGGDWHDVPGGAFTVSNNWAMGVLVDLELPPACDDQATLSIRWIMTSNARVSGDDPVSSQGVNQIDDIIVRGTRMAVPAPQALPATEIGASRFTANWLPVDDVDGYELDVATNAQFSGGFTGESPTNAAAWDFEASNRTASAGSETNLPREVRRESTVPYTFPQGTGGTGTYSLSSASWANGLDAKSWILDFSAAGFGRLKLSSRQRSSSTGPRDFKVQYRIGETGDWADVAGASVTVADNFTAGTLGAVDLPAACDNQPLVFLRWIMTSNASVTNGTVSSGTSRIDEIAIAGEPMLPGDNAFVPGYQSRPVDAPGHPVEGLVKGVYHYRLRAVEGAAVSADSDTVRVRAADTPPAFLMFSR